MQQKRQLAAQSSLFNLKDPTFAELFPDIVQVSGSVCTVLLSLVFNISLRSTDAEVTF